MIGCGGETQAPAEPAGPVLEAIAADAQEEPLRVVEAFLGHVTKLHARSREDEASEPLLAELGPDDMGSTPRLHDAAIAKWVRHGLEAPLHIFGNEHFGKTCSALFLFVPFEKYTVQSSEVSDNAAVIKISLEPSDVAVFNTFASERDVPVRRNEGEPISVDFTVRKGDGGWTIVQTWGDLDEMMTIQIAVTR
jgi:hypothetical protein